MGAVILNDDDVAGRLQFLQNGEHVSFIQHTLQSSDTRVIPRKTNRFFKVKLAEKLAKDPNQT